MAHKTPEKPDLYALSLRLVAARVRQLALSPALAADALRFVWRRAMGPVELPGEVYAVLRLLSRADATPGELAALLERAADRSERSADGPQRSKGDGSEEEAA